jgi:hypothetical protein
MYGDNPTSVLRDIAKRNSCATDTILFQRITRLVNHAIKSSAPDAPYWDGELNGLLRDLFLHTIDVTREPISPDSEIIGIYELDCDEIDGILESIQLLHSCGPDEYIDMLISEILP